MANLKLLKEARLYWLCIPSTRVVPQLRRFFEGPNGEWCTGIDGYGLDALQTCDTLACLGGWLSTMPQVHDACPSNTGIIEKLRKTFDLTDLEISELTDRRHDCEDGAIVEKSDWQVALDRLDWLIAIHEAKEEVRQ